MIGDNMFKRDAETLNKAADTVEKIADVVEGFFLNAADFFAAAEEGLDDFLTEIRANAEKLRQEAYTKQGEKSEQALPKDTETSPKNRYDKIAYVQARLAKLGIKDSKWTGTAATLLSDEQVDVAYKLWGGK